MQDVLRRCGYWVLLVPAIMVSTAITEETFADLPGLIIEDVVANSPGAKAGLKPGDTLLTYNDKALSSPAALQAAEENTVDKKEVRLRVRRGEETFALTVPVGPLGIVVRPELPRAALAFYAEGKAAQQAQRMGEAISIWTMAAKASQESGDKAAAAWLYRGLGEAYEAHRQWKEAQEMHSIAWEILKASGDSAAQSRTLSALGRCSKNLNDFPTAQRWFEQAWQVDDSAAGQVWAAADLTNLGIVAYARGDDRAAHDYHSRALAIHEQLAPSSIDVAMSLNNLAAAAFLRCDEPAAEDYCRRALAIAEPLAPESLVVAQSLNDLGFVAYVRGDLQAAHDYYSRALAIREKLAPDSTKLAMSLFNLGGIARDRGDIQAAYDYFSRAMTIRERFGADSISVAGSLYSLGHIARDRADLQTAQDYYRKALAIYERLSPNSASVANSLENLGSVAEDLGDLQAARDHHARALAIRELVSPNSLDVAESLKDLGYIALRERRFSDALSLFLPAIGIVEAQRSKLLSPESRALFLTQRSGPYTGLLRTYIAVNDVPAAFATLERAHARSLVELLAERKVNFRADAPVKLLRQQAELDEKRSITYASLARLDAKKNGPEIEGLQGALVRYFAQQRELEEKIRRSSPRFAALQYPKPLDLKGAQALLDAEMLLLTYYVDEKETYLFALTRTAIKVLTLPVGEEALNKLVKTFRNQVAIKRLGQRDPSSIKAASQQGQILYDILVRPAQEFVSQARRVLICPDGPLHALPFAALVSQTKANLRYFIEDRRLHLIASMTVYAETRSWSAENKKREPRLLAFGHPVYTKRQTESVDGQKRMPIAPERGEQTKLESVSDAEMAYLRGRGLSFDALPWTRKEVEGIGKLFGESATVRMDEEATEATARQESRYYTVLHFAVHGWLDDQIGLNSGLALSQPDVLGRKSTRDDNGLLQAWEILEQVRLNADLVVLSACETGLGQKIRGEGLIGLTRAFQYAGAKSIVVSLWAVNDASTAELMKSFYRELRKGASKDVALQKAMTAVRSKPNWRHPFYWSPFILVGDWR